MKCENSYTVDYIMVELLITYFSKDDFDFVILPMFLCFYTLTWSIMEVQNLTDRLSNELYMKFLESPELLLPLLLIVTNFEGTTTLATCSSIKGP